MAKRVPKRTAKPKRGPDGVLGTLPASRPPRIGKPRPAGAKATPKAKPRPKRAPAPPKRGATIPAARPTPTAVSPGAPPLRAVRAADAPPPEPLAAPTGAELVTTTIRAAGELAQIGLMVSGQMLKRTIDRLPRP